MFVDMISRMIFEACSFPAKSHGVVGKISLHARDMRLRGERCHSTIREKLYQKPMQHVYK